MGYASAAARPRARLTGAGAVLALAALTAAALYLLFPERELSGMLARSPAGDALAETYLRILHTLHPEDARTSLLLARARLAQGRVEDAMALAAPHLRSRDFHLRRKALEVRLDVLRRNPDRIGAFAAAAEASLRNPASREELQALAEQPELSGRQSLLHALYRRLAALEDDPALLEKAAHRFVGEGDYRFAAEILFAARKRARSLDQERRLFFEAARTLEAGALPLEALASAERELGNLARDEQTLLEMVRLARGAARPDIAARYMKRIVFPRRQLSRAPGGFLAAALLVRTAFAANETWRGVHAYDARLYGYAYEVFLESEDLDSAYRVAREAVEHEPQDAVWRERLARVAEQSRRPAQALAAWRWLAEREGTDEAWQAVLRLAQGLRDDEALGAALRYRVERHGLEADTRALALTFERLGEPREGSRWLEDRYRRTGDAVALETAADLAEHVGDDARALELDLALADIVAPSTERALRIARLQILARREADALAFLQRFPRAPQEHEYWSLVADLAWALQDDGAAIAALEALVAADGAGPGDFDRLVTLLRSRSPARATRYAELGYERHGSAGLLLQALELLWGERRLDELARLYQRLGNGEAAFAEQPYFYVLRGEYRRAVADWPGAARDLRRAAALAPDDPQPRLLLLWTVAEHGSSAELRQALSAYGAPDDASFWPVLATGWTRLHEPRRAAFYFARLARSSPGDPLWSTAYADALEQDGQVERAAVIRRVAWRDAENAARAGKMDPNRLEHFVRLALREAPGDAALRALRALEHERGPSPAADDLVLSWLLAQDLHDEAKVWMQSRYQQRPAPRWAELAVAAAEEDAEAAQRLLDRERAERIAGERPPERAPNALPENRATMGVGTLHRGALAARPLELGAGLSIGTRTLGVQYRDASQHSTDAAVLRDVPARDRELLVSDRETLSSGSLELGAGAREALDTTASAWASWSREWRRRFSFEVRLAANERTQDSAALAAAGMRNQATLRVQYLLTRTETLAARFWGTRYRKQDGVDLGSGAGYELNASHRLSAGYPDALVRAFTARLQTRTQDDAEPFFVPPSSALYGAGVSLGEAMRDSWSGAIRPFAGLDVLHNTVSGNGYSMRLGVRGRAIGSDQVLAYWTRGRSIGPSGDSVLEFAMRYEHYFGPR
jgi:hypothetical protein